MRDHKFAIQVLESAIKDLEDECFGIGDGVMQIVIREMTETIKHLKIDQRKSKEAA